MIFLLCVLSYLLIAFTNAWMIPDFAAADRVFPVFVGAVSIVGATVLLVQMMFSSEAHPLFSDSEADPDSANQYGLWPTLAWFALLLGLTSLLGFILALCLFLVSFLRLRADKSWAFSIIYTVAALALMCTMAMLLNRDFPPGVLQHYFTLPWPLS